MINAKYNTFWERLFACLIDGLIFIPLFYFESSFLNSLTETWVAITWLTVRHLSFVVYSVGMHWMDGQTLGKKLFNIQVINASEENGISFRQALARDSFYVVLSLLGVSIMITNILALDNYTFFAIYPYHDYLKYVPFIWFFLELATLFQNIKKRAVQDFIGNTVVVKLKRKN